jgi:SNF2 family DNA or RNA helicase
MGLGKTIQAVSFIMALKRENLSNKPVLVIGPKSTLVGWEQVFFSCSPLYGGVAFPPRQFLA